MPRKRKPARKARRSPAGGQPGRNRFEAMRGMAPIKWRTDELMTLLRGDD